MEVYFLILPAITNYLNAGDPVTKLKHQRQKDREGNNKRIQNRNDIKILLDKQMENA